MLTKKEHDALTTIAIVVGVLVMVLWANFPEWARIVIFVSGFITGVYLLATLPQPTQKEDAPPPSLKSRREDDFAEIACAIRSSLTEKDMENCCNAIIVFRSVHNDTFLTERLIDIFEKKENELLNQQN